MIPALELRGVTKDFVVSARGTRLRAVDRLSLRLEPGQVYGLLGSNGSGKSTTLKLVLGLLEPTAGECRVFGISCRRVAARSRIGYLPESPYFYRHLTGRELVRFHAGLSGLSRLGLAERIQEVIDRVGLTEAADRRVGTYSKGMLQRIGLAQALVHRPQLVVMDEPTAGVDPDGAVAMIDMIRRLKSERVAVLITSHHLDQVEEVCDRVALLDRGRLVAEGAVADLLPDSDRLTVDGAELSPEDRAHLEDWLGVRRCTLTGPRRPRVRLTDRFRARPDRSRS